MVMGTTGSRLEKALGDQFPEGERYFGLENFGNTCYCNSVLQVCLKSKVFTWKALNYGTSRSPVVNFGGVLFIYFQCREKLNQLEFHIPTHQSVPLLISVKSRT
jgi:hypothetical protein